MGLQQRSLHCGSSRATTRVKIGGRSGRDFLRHADGDRVTCGARPVRRLYDVTLRFVRRFEETAVRLPDVQLSGAARRCPSDMDHGGWRAHLNNPLPITRQNQEHVMAKVQSPPAAAEHRLQDCLSSYYNRVRATSAAICEPLAIEDFVVQSMADASPAKWHLAHTSWFFEQFILKPHAPDYRVFQPQFEYLFNSYYQTVGPMHQRPLRGLLTRPTVAEVFAYRTHVDEQMQSLLEKHSAAIVAEGGAIESLVTLGLNHEQQHQELMFTDIKHLLSCNPLLPAYRSSASQTPAVHAVESRTHAVRFIACDGGIREIGTNAGAFCFDNETPRHRTLVEPYALADRLVTNAEYLEFVRDGGYRRADLWLSDGWATVTGEGWSRPLYWSESLDAEFTLAGLQPVNPAAPVCHLSYYEADAFARWAGDRLPTEAEWELAADKLPVAGNLCGERLERAPLHPTPAGSGGGLRQMYGDVWEWTASPYIAYPRYEPPSGALGEYNGKFMCNQWVLRGGSCVTPADHIRSTYRNFFYPHARWQFMGVRLARSL
jgi:ergothioneine biosynthesis protein EgtB